jgi:hypothetical protein
MSDPETTQPADPSPETDADESVEDSVDTDRLKAPVEPDEWGSGQTSPTRPTVPASPDLADVAVLRGWTRAEGPDMAAVALALSIGSSAVDQFLAESPHASEFGRALLSGEVYELGAATDEGRSIPSARWLALAKTSPEAFVWHVPPPYVLPIENRATARQFADLLLPWLERADLRVTLNWLGSPGFLRDAKAVARIEELVRAQASIVGWSQSVDALEAMIRRGGRWRAARTLERLLRDLHPDRTEAVTIQRVARKCMDAQLFARMAFGAPWKTDDALLGDLADRIPTRSLVQGFFDEGVVHRAHLRGEAAKRVQRAAWRALSGRDDPEALLATVQLAMREIRAGRDLALCRDMLMGTQQAHGSAAVEPLTAIFLSGIHRTDPGEFVESFLMEHAEAALMASLMELPEWVPSFDESAMERLAWRCVKRLDADARERVGDMAELVEGVAAQRVLRELDGV